MLRANAKSLRSDMTRAERTLWFRLRAHRLNGFSFRRQTPIGSFIVDFVCHEAMLVVELDGGQHADSKRDLARDAWLFGKGYRVLHFWNSDILGNLSAVLESILDALQDQTPLPDPPPQGGREQAMLVEKSK